jgi:hypothetical protein
MSVSHHGKTPGKLWTVTTRMVAFSKAVTYDKQTRTDLFTGCKKLGFAIAAPALYMLTHNYAPMVLAVPFVTPIAATVCVIATAAFGVSAYKSLRASCTSYAVKNNICASENKWLDVQRQGGFIKCIQYKLGQAISVLVAASGIGVTGINMAKPDTFAPPSPEQKTVLHDVAQSQATGPALAGTGILGFAACAFADKRRRKALSATSSASLRK